MLLFEDLAFQTKLVRLLGHVLEVDCNRWALKIVNRLRPNHCVLTLDRDCLILVYLLC